MDINNYVNTVIFEKLENGTNLTEVEEGYILEYLDFDSKLEIINYYFERNRYFENILYNMCSLKAFCKEGVYDFIINHNHYFNFDVKNSYFTINDDDSYSFYSITDVEKLLNHYKDDIITEFEENYLDYF